MKTTRQSKRYVGDRPSNVATPCEHPGCTQPGVYRAPRDRSLSDYVWLCLDHVREYNKSWNYYDGLTQTEIEQEIRQDTVWHRRTWKLGEQDAKTARAFHTGKAKINDPFNVFSDDPLSSSKTKREVKAKPGSPEYAMEILDLKHPLTRQGLKMRYHALAKKHHPDRNGGDKEAEERLKTINEAYTTLLRFLNKDTRQAAR